MFRRRGPTKSDVPPPNGYGGVNTAQWLEDMPAGASLHVRRDGEYIEALDVESCWDVFTDVPNLETTLLEQLASSSSPRFSLHSTFSRHCRKQ